MQRVRYPYFPQRSLQGTTNSLGLQLQFAVFCNQAHCTMAPPPVCTVALNPRFSVEQSSIHSHVNRKYAESFVFKMSDRSAPTLFLPNTWFFYWQVEWRSVDMQIDRQVQEYTNNLTAHLTGLPYPGIPQYVHRNLTQTLQLLCIMYTHYDAILRQALYYRDMCYLCVYWSMTIASSRW